MTFSTQLNQRQNNGNDKYYTPPLLAKRLISLVPFQSGDVVCDNAPINPVFFNNFPKTVRAIKGTDNFFDMSDHVDWFVTNPPFSIMRQWIPHTVKLALKGFGYVGSSWVITSPRLLYLESNGFYLTHLHYFRVAEWFGDALFYIFQKEKQLTQVSYDNQRYHAET